HGAVSDSGTVQGADGPRFSLHLSRLRRARDLVRCASRHLVVSRRRHGHRLPGPSLSTTPHVGARQGFDGHRHKVHRHLARVTTPPHSPATPVGRISMSCGLVLTLTARLRPCQRVLRPSSAGAQTLSASAQTLVNGWCGTGGNSTVIWSLLRTVPLRETIPMTPVNRSRLPSAPLRR